MKKSNLKHGDEIECPTCGFPGRYDCDPSPEAVFKDSIWYNVHCGWECVKCWLK